MALKNPSEYFKETSNISKANDDNDSIESSEFVSAFDSFKRFSETLDNYKLSDKKIEILSEKVNEIQEEIQNFLKKEDLDNAIMSQLLFVEKGIREIQSKVNGINEEKLKDIRENISDINEVVNNFTENEIPKYKKLLVSSERRIYSKYEEFEEDVENLIKTISECVEEKYLELNTSFNELKESNSDLSGQVFKKLKNIETLKENIIKKISYFDDYEKKVNKKIGNLGVEILKNEKQIKDIENYLEENHQELIALREEVFAEISNIPIGDVEKNVNEIKRKISYIEEIYKTVDPDKLVNETIKESLLAEPPSTKNKDPLTPLDQKFVTFEKLQEHYRLFINRIQQQLATLGGGGETQLKYLDDIVGIGTNASAYDGKYLKYDHALKKFVFDNVSTPDIAEENIIYVAKDGNDSNSGTLSNPKLTIKNAVSIASANTVIKIAPGTYYENNPIVLPDNVTVMGHSLRENTIVPLNPDQDLFHVGNKNYIAEMSFTGSLQGTAIVAFDPVNQRYIDQSPYVQNCTNFIPNSIGMRINGKDAIGPLKSMVLDSYTQYNQGGIGVSITNEGYAQLVSLFTICDDIAVYCGSGAACDLTNSNSSFGNYGLVADGVSPKKYVGIVTVASAENSDTFVLNLTPSSFNVVDADYNNVTGRIKITTDQPHKFNVGMGVTIAGLGFTCPFEPGIRYYPSGQVGYVFNVETVAPGRYLDAADLIQANKQEIQDKSLASIALNHPDFIFPGDPANDERYRYYDSYRLVQKNKQEIVDKSLASVAIAHSDFYFPGDTQTTIRSRYYDSYRLIQRNKEVIVGAAWTALSTNYPSFNYSETKCRRDIGFFVDAVSTDVFTGGNNYSRGFVLQYFDGNNPIGIATTERAPSVYAFEQARDLMKQAITNTLVGAAYSDLTLTADPLTGFNTSPFSCADVRSNIDNLVGIVTVSIGAGNTLSLPASPNIGYFNLSVGIGTTVSPGGVKCARDLGYLIDAVSTDLFTGGNKYSRDFTLQYFDGSTPTGIGTSERGPSVTAFNALRDYAKKAITNQLNYKEVGISSGPAEYGGIGPNIPVLPSGNSNSCTDVQDAINTLVEIVTNVIGSGSTSILTSVAENSGSFTDVGNVCYRDIGYIVDAVVEDLRGYTNSNIIDATKKYFNYSGTQLYLVGEEQESITAFNAARDYMKLALNNQLNVKDLTVLAGISSIGSGGPIIPILPSGSPDACSDVRHTIDTEVAILTTAIGIGSLSSIPNVSLASTIFTLDVGIATQPHYYAGGGTAQTNVIRPFDGQAVYFNELFYTVKTLNIVNGGSGYVDPPTITIDPPDVPWGIPAQAVATLENGSVVSIDMVSNGRGYRVPPKVTISAGINTAVAIAELVQEYYTIQKSTELVNGICIITLNENVPFEVGVGTEVSFFKQSRVLATGHSFEFIGSGTDIATCLPFSGGVPIEDNETDSRNGGLVVYSSTNQSGNFKIGDGVKINQNTGSISGTAYTKSLFSTMTPFILSLGGF